MKPKLYLLLPFLLLTCLSHAQSDWQLFRPGVQYLYDHEEADYLEPGVVGVKTDAAPCTEMYLSLKWRGELECSEIGSSFWGYEICQLPEETHLRVRPDEYVTIRQTAALDEVWLAYIHDTDTVWARVAAIELLDFSGLTDSVKTIYFYRQNGNNPPEYLPADDRPILLSKQYGLIRSIIFQDFPYNDLPGAMHSLPLIGLSEPKVGLQNPNLQDIFNLHIGDELHLLKTTESLLYDNQGMSLGYGLQKEYLKATISNVMLNANPAGITFSYTGQQIKTRRVGPPTGTYQVFPVENVSGSWGFDFDGLEFLDLQPGAIVMDSMQWGQPMVQSVLVGGNPGFLCNRAGKGLGVPLLEWEETGCYRMPTDVGPDPYFIEGLAGIYQYEVSFGGVFGREIVYFHQDSVECGTPFDFEHITAAGEASTIPDILLGPNPTNGPVTLQLPEGLTADLKLYDTHGQVLLSENQAQSTVVWNIATLPAGTYQLGAWQNGQLLWQNTILKL